MKKIIEYKFINYFKELETQNYWDFLNKKDKPIDVIAPYPAKMVSDMQGEIIAKILEEKKIKSVLDPFMGSGTILTESISLGIKNIYGNDINPLSYLIVKVKTTKLNIKKIDDYYLNLIEAIKGNPLKSNRYFFKITKWFSISTIHQLSQIINQIERIDDKDIKDFFSLAFTSLVKEVSNTRNSTFKLHIKAEIIIYENCLERFEKIIKKQIKNCSLFWNNEKYDRVKTMLYEQNILDLKLSKKIDLIITSPPYGDNQTTVTYGQFSILQLKWLGEGKYSENFSSIDSASLGGKLCTLDEIDKKEIYNISEELRTISNKLLKETDSKKARKVVTFMNDFYQTFKKMNDFLAEEGLIILTVGNRRVNNNLITFNKIIDDMALELNLCKVQEFSRNLPNIKKIAKKTSKLSNGESVRSMNKEYVLIYKK